MNNGTIIPENSDIFEKNPYLELDFVEKTKHFQSIPTELIDTHQWVVWKAEKDPNHPGKIKKVPVNPKTGKNVSPTDPQNWLKYDHAYQSLKEGKADGIGFAFSKDDPYCGIDMDKVFQDGTLTEEAQSIVKELNSYTEKTQSFNGLHIITKAKLPGSGRRQGFLEIYDDKRFFVFTGIHLEGTPKKISEKQDETISLYSKLTTKNKNTVKKMSSSMSQGWTLSNEQIIEKIRSSKQSDKFRPLFDNGSFDSYPSQNEADLALCAMFAFYTRDNESQIDELFRKSALYREDKWEREDYRKNTIRKAINNCSNFYQPPRKTQSPRKPLKEEPILEGKPGKLKELITSLGYSFRHNVVNGRTEFSRNKKDFRSFEERDYKTLSTLCRSKKGFNTLPDRDLKDLIGSEFLSKTYDPFKEYLDSLVWDGNDWIQRLFEAIVFKDKSNFSKTLLKRFLVAASGCMYGEIVNENCLVFKGSQGIGKSTLLENLISKTPLKAYCTSVRTIRPDDKDSLLQLSEMALINLDELAALKKAEIDAIKSIFSQSQITVRRPYGRYPETLLRRASFVGSTNNDQFLTDQTGNRRWFVFDVIDIERGKVNILNYDQIWAQAYFLYQSGEPCKLTFEEIKSLDERNSYFLVDSPEEDYLLRFFSKPEYETDGEWLTTTEISDRIAKLLDRPNAVNNNFIRNLGKSLVKNGFEKKNNRVRGVKAHRWFIHQK